MSFVCRFDDGGPTYGIRRADGCWLESWSDPTTDSRVVEWTNDAENALLFFQHSAALRAVCEVGDGSVCVMGGDVFEPGAGE